MISKQVGQWALWGVLAQSTALTLKNDIGFAGKKRFRSSWCGPDSGLVLTWEDSEEETDNWGYRSTDHEEEDEEDEIDEDEDGNFVYFTYLSVAR